MTIKPAELAEPPEWQEGSRVKYWFSFLFIMGIAVAIALLAVIFYRLGYFAAVKYAVVFGLLLVFIAIMGYLSRLRNPRGSRVYISQYKLHPATEIRCSLVMYLCLVFIFACMAALMFFMTSTFYLIRNEEKVTLPLLAVAVFGLLGAYCAARAIYVRRGKLLLSQEGVYYRSWSYEVFLSWRQVISVSAAQDNGPLIVILAAHNADWVKRQLAPIPLAMDRLPRSPVIMLDCFRFSFDKNLLYHLLRFYQTHAAARAELGTPAVLNRIKHGDWT